MQSVEQRIKKYMPFFGKWVLNDPPEMLGRGNSGVVYLAYSNEDDATAALKVIPIPRDEATLEAMRRECGGDENRVRERIDQELYYARTEIEIMEKLKSDSHIVCFEDSAIYKRTDTYGYDVLIRMERLVRLDIFLKTAEKYRLTRGTGLYLRIWSELVSGLRLCERCNIVHLDIKPDNIFYAEPSRDYFKLGDFGVSIRSENGRTVGKGMIVGTPDYMAPEVYAGRGGDMRSDMYSLALVVYSMFNNDKLPFMDGIARPTEEDFKEAQNRRFRGEEIPPIHGMKPGLSAILLKCLRFRPEDRYVSMEALYTDLERYRLETTQTIGGSTRKGPRWAPIAIAAAAVGLMTFIGVSLFSSSRSPRETPPALEETLRPEETAVPVAFTVDPIDGGTIGGADGYGYAGTAAPGETLQVFVNGSEAATVLADENGRWEYALDTAALADGMEYTIEFRGSAGTSQRDHFVFDGSVALSPDAAEVSPGAVLSGVTEGGARVSLLAGEQELASAVAGEDGRYTLDPSDPAQPFELSARESYTLLARDAAGNSVSTTITVLSFEALSVRDFDGLPQNDGGDYLIGRESGAVHTLRISGEEGMEAVAEIRDRTGGETTVSGQVRDGSAALEMEFEEGVFDILLHYRDKTEGAASLRVLADFTAPEVSLAQRPTALRSVALEVSAEAGSRIRLTDENGELLEEGTADESGLLILGEREYGYGTYTLTAADPVGNQGEYVFSAELPLTVDELTVDSEALTVHTAPEADVAVYRVDVRSEADASGGEVYTLLGEGAADGNGLFVLALDGDAVADDIYEVRVSLDDRSRAARATVGRLRVDMPIQIREGLFGDGQLVSGDLTVSGSAERDMRLLFSWNDTPVGESWTDEAGNYSFSLNGRDLLPPEGETGRVSVSYPPEVIGGEVRQSPEIHWDGYIELSVDELTEDSTSLRIYTEAGALVEVRDPGGAVLGTAEPSADEEGLYIWSPASGGFVQDAEYYVSAADRAGNTAETGPVSVSTTARREIVIDALPELVGGEKLTVSGSAEPEKNLQVQWAGQTVASAASDPQGRFEFELDRQDCGIPAEGAEETLAVSYEDGIGRSRAASVEVRWDAFAYIALDPLSEDDVALTGHADPGAAVVILRNEETVASTEADAEGALFWEAGPGAFEAGDVWTAVAEDGAGNSAFAEEITVAESRRAAIALDETGMPALYLNMDTVTLRGTAEPGTQLSITWNEGPQILTETDGAGSFAAEFPASMCELPATGQSGRFVLAYSDGLGKSRSASSGEYIWDVAAALSVQEIDEGSGSITVSAEPGALVSVYRGGEVLAEDIVAGGDGQAAWSPEGSFALGEVYRVEVTDAAGNTNAQEVTVLESSRAPITLSVDGLENGLLAEEPLTVHGTAEPGLAMVEILWNGDSLGTCDVDETGAFSGSFSAGQAALPPEGVTAELTAVYADGRYAAGSGSVLFTWDCLADVEFLQELTEDDTSLRLQTDPGAEVSATCGEKSAYGTADEEGLCEVPLERSWLLAGETWQVTVRDRVGNRKTAEITVGETSRRQITAEIRDLTAPTSGMNDSLTLHIGAEPDTQVDVYLRKNDESAFGMVVRIGGDGSGEVTLTAEDCGIPAEGEWIAFELCYTDDVGRESGTRYLETESFFWDCTPPMLVLDKTALDARDSSVSGSTDGTDVSAELNGSELPVDLENGRFTVDGLQLAAGDTLRVTAWDDARNPAFAELTVRGDAALPAGEADTEGGIAPAAEIVLESGGRAAVFADRTGPFAVGLDEPIEAFSNDEILLTGWYYGQGDDYIIPRVTVRSLDRPWESELTADTDSEASLEEILGTSGVCYLPRQTEQIPEEVRRQVALDAPLETRSGFIINLNQFHASDLPDGRYAVELTTQVTSAEDETVLLDGGSVVIEIRDGAAEGITGQELEELARSWYPAVPETPEPTPEPASETPEPAPEPASETPEPAPETPEPADEAPEEGDANWRVIGGNLYFIRDDGTLQTGWFTVGDDLYYAGSDGAVLRDTVAEIDGVTYSFDEEGRASEYEEPSQPSGQAPSYEGWTTVGGSRYFIREDGSVLTGLMGVADGSWYYFDEQGRLQTGSFQIGGRQYTADEDGVIMIDYPDQRTRSEIWAAALEVYPSLTDYADAPVTVTVDAAGGTLNLRSGPSAGSTLIGTLPSGVMLPVYADRNGWALVEFDGTWGWCSRDYLYEP